MTFITKPDIFEVRFRKSLTDEPVRLKGLKSKYGLKYMLETGRGMDFRSQVVEQTEMENFLLTLFNNSKGKGHKNLRKSILTALEWIHNKSIDQ